MLNDDLQKAIEKLFPEADRSKALEMVEQMLSSGFQVQTPDQSTAVKQILSRLENSPKRAEAIYEASHRRRKLWLAHPELYRAFAWALTRGGKYAKGYEVATEGHRHFPDDAELLYVRALASSRGGNLKLAARLTRRLIKNPDLTGQLHVDALSLRGKVYKKAMLRTAKDNPQRAVYARKTAENYEHAYNETRDTFPGINAASMWLMADDRDRCRKLASEVLAKEQQAKVPDAYLLWHYATLGEAHLLLEDYDSAIAEYTKLSELPSIGAGDLASMTEQLQLLSEKLDFPEKLFQLIRTGPVLYFVGHMLDYPPSFQMDDRPMRFPPSPALERELRTEIDKKLDEVRPAKGFCSGACGSDLLFAEAMLERGTELHLVLPFALEDFYQTSVDFGLEYLRAYRKRFQAICDNPKVQKHYATEQRYLSDPVMWENANRFAQGITLLTASQIRAQPMALAVREPNAPRRRGGTTHFIEEWQERGFPVKEINLQAIRERVDPQLPEWWGQVSPPQDWGEAPTRGHRRAVKCILFSDLKNYSKLQDHQTPAFFSGWLKELVNVIHSAEHCPVCCNTWGDGLFMIFNQAKDAASFALSLLKKLESIAFEEMGLPKDTTVRIGMHAGPVFPHWDQITGRQNFFGTQVNRAARIEPATLPGCAYVSEQFASMLALEEDHDFECEHIGFLELGKSHDRFQCKLYQLYRADSGDSEQ